ncbi:scavenger receptor cysteine-rich domain superfamily protein-like [Lytechinus variegatus]|uniref:scavenger receptor cysteine-rich domain superfamily protein-like n=1 Tax=Lytechinus variegatus TaxID=7654 RepID=UPI001BB21788|nr:scavenger receptor cysteine-rich domain superfamily protein-like [Lytechinus variegatus]
MANNCSGIYLCLALTAAYVTYVSSVSIRLTGGTKPSQGHLEILISGGWGTFCGNSWDIQDTVVVCRQLGFPGAVTFTSTSTPSVGDGNDRNTGLIVCAGDESSISECIDPTISLSCTRFLDVEIICQDFGYDGCYLWNNLTIAPWPTLTKTSMTNDLCLEECQSQIRDEGYAILQDADCICENSLTGFSPANDWNCTNLCLGDRSQSCGGRNAYTVFRTDVGFCSNPEPPHLGDATVDWTRYGSFVEFSCIQDFELVGNRTLQCLGSAADQLEWNGETPLCAEKTFLILGLVFTVIGGSIVFLSMVCVVGCEIRRKTRMKHVGGHNRVDTEHDHSLFPSMPTIQDTHAVQWNPQSEMAQQSHPPAMSSGVPISHAAPSRPLQTPPPLQVERRLPTPVGVSSATAASSGEYAGIYEELDEYVSPGEDIGGGMELVFERHPSEEDSNTLSPHSPQSMSITATDQDEAQTDEVFPALGNENNSKPPEQRSGQSKEGEDGYSKVHSDQGEDEQDRYLKVRSDIEDGYLKVRPDEVKPTDPDEDRPNTYLEVIGEGEASVSKHHSSHDYSYISDISKVDIRPRLPLPLQQDDDGEQSEYDDTAVQPVYRNEGVIFPKVRRPNAGT